MANNRDVNGRFVKGGPGGPGRPKRKTEERYIRAMVNTVSIAEWRQIVQTGVREAIGGDLGWARFIADYLAGKPIQRREVTGKDGGPLAVRINDVLNALPTELRDLVETSLRSRLE